MTGQDTEAMAKHVIIVTLVEMTDTDGSAESSTMTTGGSETAVEAPDGNAAIATPTGGTMAAESAAAVEKGIVIGGTGAEIDTDGTIEMKGAVGIELCSWSVNGCKVHCCMNTY